MSKGNEDNKGLIFPKYTIKEEIANAVSHGFGVIFGLIASFFLIKDNFFNIIKVTCYSIYSASLVLLYFASTLYHALKVNRAKKVFRVLDHCSIFLLIAGTYTPLVGIFLKRPLNLISLLAIWFIALVGIILNIVDINKFALFSLICYVSMGWLALFIIKPILNSLSCVQAFWFFAGGIFYTFGLALYIIGKKVKYFHFIWHIFVLFGSVSHFFIFT